jgi:Ca-activated chloride channel family protein
MPTHPSNRSFQGPETGGAAGRDPSAARRARRAPGAHSFVDASTGFRGWIRALPGRREVVTPCVLDGRVFVGGGFGSHEFFAFDAATGAVLWERRMQDDGPTAAVAADGCVAFNTESCTVCVLEAETGRRLWERWLGDPLLAQPAVGGGRLFMAWPGRDRQHRIGAFEVRGGQLLWSAAIGADVITAPVFAEGDLFASTFDGTVHCFDAETGRSRWTRALRATSAPWVWKGEVFVSEREEGARPADAPRETLSALRAQRLRKLGEAKRAAYLRSRRGTRHEREDWLKDSAVGFGSAPEMAKLHFAESLTGATTVSRAWSFQGSRPCVWNGRVFSVVGDELAASALDSGRELWRWKAGFDAAAERAITPPAVANGRVYAATREGRVLSWEAETGALRWRLDLGAPISWQPVVSGGRVFVGCVDGTLRAFSTGDPLDDGWPMWGGGPGHNG